MDGGVGSEAKRKGRQGKGEGGAVRKGLKRGRWRQKGGGVAAWLFGGG